MTRSSSLQKFSHPLRKTFLSRPTPILSARKLMWRYAITTNFSSLRRFVFIFLSIFLIAGQALAEPIPPELNVDGKPVEPTCFLPAINRGRPEKDVAIELQHCENQGFSVKPETEATHSAAGFGYFLTDGAGRRWGSMYYRFVGYKNNDPIVAVSLARDKSEELNAVYRFVRKGTKANLISVASGGDRCNGGIRSVFIKHDQLLVERNLTPVSLLVEISKSFGWSEQPTEYLPNAAADCVATGTYVGSKLQTVRFEESSNVSQNVACFLGEALKLKGQNRTVLKPTQLENLPSRVGKNCVTIGEDISFESTEIDP